MEKNILKLNKALYQLFFSKPADSLVFEQIFNIRTTAETILETFFLRDREVIAMLSCNETEGEESYLEVNSCILSRAQMERLGGKYAERTLMSVVKSYLKNIWSFMGILASILHSLLMKHVEEINLG
jgi:hypothetical protein